VLESGRSDANEMAWFTAIQDNIHELRTLRRAVDLFHVEFKAL
jgi:hypothetical protein